MLEKDQEAKLKQLLEMGREMERDKFAAEKYDDMTEQVPLALYRAFILLAFCCYPA